MNKSKKMLLKLKERQIELGKLFGRGKDNQIIGFGNILEPIETREKVAGFVGVSYKTLQKAEELVKAADQESER